MLAAFCVSFKNYKLFPIVCLILTVLVYLVVIDKWIINDQ